jgi:hypothetical protein
VENWLKRLVHGTLSIGVRELYRTEITATISINSPSV